MNKPKDAARTIIGRRDKVDFPRMRLYDIDAKIDTGAYTSSIHCHNIKVREKDGERYVTFNLLDPSHPDFNDKRFRVKLHALRNVKSSTGKSEKRCFIKTAIRVYGQNYEIELSLSDRSNMDFPVLLGRKLLSKRFIVDVTKTNLSYKHKLKGRKK